VKTLVAKILNPLARILDTLDNLLHILCVWCYTKTFARRLYAYGRFFGIV